MIDHELLQKRVDKCFLGLKELPTMDTRYIEYTEAISGQKRRLEAYTFCNGELRPEGEPSIPCVTLEQAIELTEQKLAEIERKYKHIWIRVFPQAQTFLDELDIPKYYVYFRIAYTNDEIGGE